jgi:hypothetical protein
MRAKAGPQNPDVVLLERKVASLKAAAPAKPVAGRITADVGNRPFRAALTTISEQLADSVICQVVVPKSDLQAALLWIGKPRRPRD